MDKENCFHFSKIPLLQLLSANITFVAAKIAHDKRTNLASRQKQMKNPHRSHSNEASDLGARFLMVGAKRATESLLGCPCVYVRMVNSYFSVVIP